MIQGFDEDTSYTKDELRSQLPKVGDRLKKRRPGLYAKDDTASYACTVVYVNIGHLWYCVRFEDGTHGCYKLPE